MSTELKQGLDAIERQIRLLGWMLMINIVISAGVLGKLYGFQL